MLSCLYFREDEDYLEKMKKYLGMEKPAERRPRKHLSLAEKAYIINVCETSKKTHRQLAAEFNVGRTQIGSVFKRKEEILQKFTYLRANGLSGEEKPFFTRRGQYSEVNELTWEWVQRCVQAKVKVTGCMIQRYALRVAQEIGIGSEFKASNGWLHSFRHSFSKTKYATTTTSQDDVVQFSDKDDNDNHMYNSTVDISDIQNRASDKNCHGSDDDLDGVVRIENNMALDAIPLLEKNDSNKILSKGSVDVHQWNSKDSSNTSDVAYSVNDYNDAQKMIDKLLKFSQRVVNNELTDALSRAAEIVQGVNYESIGEIVTLDGEIITIKRELEN